MIDIKKTILKQTEKSARKVFPGPNQIVLKDQNILTRLSGLITMTSKDSFARIENDMSKFPMIQDIDFRFLPDNPNRKYHLVKGLYDTSEIEARLITDGEEEKTIKHSFGRNNILNPLSPDHEIRLTDSALEEVEIRKATFAIEQYLVGGRIEFLRFISEITDRDELRRISRYILYTENQKDINVLSLRREK